MTIPLAPLDDRLAEVRAVVERLGANLLELDADPARHILDATVLTGASAAAWAGSAERLGRLWQGYTDLSEALREATALRGERRRPGEAELARLQTLLLGPAVPDRTPTSTSGQSPGGDPPTPAAQRSIDEAVAALSADFALMADAVARVGVVWNEVLPRLDDLDESLDRAESEGQAAGIRLPNELAALRRQVGTVRERTGGDPLSIQPQEVEALAAAIERAGAGVRNAVGAGRELDRNLADAGADLDVIAGILTEAVAAMAESTAKLARWNGPESDLRRAESEVAALRAELDALTAPSRHRSTQEAAGRGVTAIRRRSAALADEAGRLADACGGGLAVRAELRGRLRAYRARASAAGRGEDLALDTLFRQAEEVLYGAPCDLREAGRLVTRYQQAVRGPSRPSPEDP